MTNHSSSFSQETFELVADYDKISSCGAISLRDMEGSTTAKGDRTAVKNGICNGEVNGNSANMEANGYASKKTAKKPAARGKTRLGMMFSLLWLAWFLVECVLGYIVVLFILVPPLVPLVVVYFLLKMLERVVVKMTTGEIALSGQDALWQQTSDENRLIINGLVYAENKSNFDDALNDFRQVVLERLVNAKKPNGELIYPRARCCIRPGFFQYFFQEDKSFRIENHVFKWEGEVPSSKEELASIVSKLSNEAFPKGQSPWYFCCVPTNFGDQEFASVFRMSHSIADGVALSRFLINQLPDQTTPQMEPQKFSSTGRALLLAKALLITPSFLIKLLLSFADQNILHGPKISGVKKVVWHEGFELKLIKEIKTVTGTTVNDVLMSCLSRAIRRYFQRKGVDSPPDFAASIPVDVRLSAASKKELSFENKFSLIFLKLATATEGVLEQMYETKARMDEMKVSGEALASAGLMILTNELCPEFVIRIMNTFITQKASCVLSNVPGPQYFLTVSGQRVKYMIFWPPQRNNIGLGLSIFTYAGQVIVGVQSDVTVLPDPEIITEEFGNAVNEMAKCVLHSDGISNGHALQ